MAAVETDINLAVCKVYNTAKFNKVQSKADMYKILECIKKLPESVNSVDFSECDFMGIADGQTTSSRNYVRHLEDNAVVFHIYKEIIQNIPAHIIHLDLRNNQIGDEVLKIIPEHIETLDTRRETKMDRNAGLFYAAALKANLANLKTLNADINLAELIFFLNKAGCYKTKLTEASFHQISIVNDKFAAFLRDNPNLKTLRFKLLPKQLDERKFSEYIKGSSLECVSIEGVDSRDFYINWIKPALEDNIKARQACEPATGPMSIVELIGNMIECKKNKVAKEEVLGKINITGQDLEKISSILNLVYAIPGVTAPIIMGVLAANDTKESASPRVQFS